MVDLRRVLPKDVHFTTEPCQILADMNSYLQSDYLEILKRYPYSDGLRDVSICQSSQPTDAERLIDQVRKGEQSWVGIGWLIFITSFVNAARKKNMSAVEYADWIYDQCKKINDEVGYRAAWIEAYGEIGNSVTWPKGKKFTKKEAMQYFRGWLRDGRSLTEHWGRCSDPATLTYFTHAKRRDKNLRNLPIYYSEGTLFSIHEAFRNGFPLVAYEGCCGSMDSFQTGIAFTRGGAKMFDAWWGIDLSPWTYSYLGEVCRVNNAGVRQLGMAPECLYRIWLSSYLAGCNTLLHEVGYTFFYTKEKNGTVMLSDYGYKAMQFYRLTQDVLADRGTPVVPFAIMLEEEHGYRGSSIREHTEQGELLADFDPKTVERRLGIWSGQVGEITPGDWQVQKMIDTIFPCADNLWGKYRSRWPEEKIPNFDQTDPELSRKIDVGQIDAREETMFLRDSRWADCFDVIIEDTAEEVLEKYYKVIVPAGDIRTDHGLWERLGRYVERGGRVVLTVEQLDETARAELGIGQNDSAKEIYVETMSAGKNTIDVKEELRVYALNTAGSVWAADQKTGTPLILDIAKGNGHFYLVMCSYGMEKSGRKISAVVKALMDSLYAEFVGITRNGPPCQMVINRRTDDTLVTLLNNTGKDWLGEVVFGRDDYPAVEEVRDLVSDQAYPKSLVEMGEKSVSVRTRVPAYGTKILSFGPVRSAQAYRGILTSETGMKEEDVAYIAEIRKQGPLKVVGKAP